MKIRETLQTNSVKKQRENQLLTISTISNTNKINTSDDLASTETFNPQLPALDNSTNNSPFSVRGRKPYLTIWFFSWKKVPKEFYY
jgi:hypothetical protein